ncbi:MAG: DUF4055 domain-containing protein [Acidobacteriota bacterium]|nr:DUF4055 domain-containing protein [Acidobacteriota bacterium]
MAGVDTTHPQYSASRERWQRCRDLFEGTDAVKGAGETYLPKLAGQKPAAYAAYKTRAVFYNGFARTVQGLVGSVFRKSPSVTVPEALQASLLDVTRSGVPFEALAMRVLEDVLTVGRRGVLLDQPVNAPANAAPYWVLYAEDQIVNWRTTVIDGQRRLSLLVLKERIEDAADAFAVSYVDQYRELRVADGMVVVQLYRNGTGEHKGTLVKHDLPIVLTRRGEKLTAIPFVFFSPTGLEPDVVKPPLLDLADVNLSHYRTSADLEHGRHFTGLPQPWVAGVTGDDKLQIGSSVAWKFSDPNAKAGYLEFTGQGLKELREALEEKATQMAILGARMLEGQKPGVEAAETVKLRHAGDSATLKSIAMVCSMGLTECLRWHAWWAGQDVKEGDVSCELNTDFFGLRLTAEEVKTLMLAWQSNAISYETFYDRLTEGGWSRPGISSKQELEDIAIGDDATGPPTLPEPAVV